MKLRAIPSALVLATALIGQGAAAQATPDWSVLERPRTNTPRPTTPAITIEDLRTRLFIFSDDSMRGRELGDRGNVMGTAYLAAEAKRIGLEPAGDNGGYLQLVPVMRRGFDDHARIRISDLPLDPKQDYLLRDQGDGQRSIDGVPSVYAGTWGDPAHLISRDAAAGKVVILSVKPDDMGGGMPGVPNRQVVAAYFERAAAVMVVALDKFPPGTLELYLQPGIALREDHPTPVATYMYITSHVARAALGGDLAQMAPGTSGLRFNGNPAVEETPVDQPAYNVVGIVRGSDPVLRNEYIAIGAHNDHIGVDRHPLPHDSIYVVNHLYRPQGEDDPEPDLTASAAARVNAILADIRKKTHGASARLDSVYNGADDDGTGSVSLLELAEYFAAQKVKPKRSLLFIWHVGEEQGLYGSEWFTDHPSVPRDSIVAELNMDMEGRGDASDITGVTKDGKAIGGSDNYLQLIGSRRLSTELGDLVEKVNATEKPMMTLDYSLDADAHPQQIYCRSDHYEYARYGIPIVFFTTGGHADYHQLTDEPQYIDYAHMQRVVDFVKDIAVATANLDHRPVVNKPKPDPNGACRQ